jgi:hypothetical protein
VGGWVAGWAAGQGKTVSQMMIYTELRNTKEHTERKTHKKHASGP